MLIPLKKRKQKEIFLLLFTTAKPKKKQQRQHISAIALQRQVEMLLGKCHE